MSITAEELIAMQPQTDILNEVFQTGRVCGRDGTKISTSYFVEKRAELISSLFVKASDRVPANLPEFQQVLIETRQGDHEVAWKNTGSDRWQSCGLGDWHHDFFKMNVLRWMDIPA